MEDRWIGTTIDRRYRIARRLGSGGMGVVYEAEHVGLGRRVAIKVMRTEHVEPTLLARFRREAKLASQITHPNIVQVFDVGSEGGIDFIAMELVTGRDLGAMLAAGRLPVERAVAIACAMLEALQVVHDAGIIHRDVKPGNVLVTAAGDVKLMDFGIARSLDDGKLTRTGHIVGTTEFMSPEQFRGAAIDHRTDLYAVGITLHAMLVGEVPFRGGTAEVAGLHVFAPPPSLAKLRPEIPAHVVAAVDRALAKSPDDRFPTARAFAAALAAAEPAPRRGSWLPLIAALGVIGGVAIALAIRVLTRHEVARPPADAIAQVPVAIAPALDAASVAAPPLEAAAPLPDAAIARTTVAAPAPAVPPRGASLCDCIPTDAPDVRPLCPTAGAPRCRCDSEENHALCEDRMELACIPEHTIETGAIGPTKWVPLDGGDPCAEEESRCSYDPTAFRREGTADAPCTGFLAPYHGPKGVVHVETGHTDCDVCPGAKLRAFPGHAGDACTGFYYRTGAVAHGKLDFCQ